MYVAGRPDRSSARAGAAYGGHRGAAGLIAQQCAPSGDVVVVGPGKKRLDLWVGCRRSIVEHRIDQNLLRDRGPAAVARQQAYACGQAATRTVAHHRDAGGLDAEFGRMLGQPRQCRVAVLDRSGVAMLGCDPIVDDEHRHSRIRDVVTDQQLVHGADVFESEDHAAAVQIQRGAARPVRPRRVKPRQIQLGAVGGRQ